MRGYKAFEKGLICKGKQYAENAVFEEEKAEICNSGMHFCKYPLDVFDYYPLIDDKGSMSEFAEVEALDECKTDDNRKYCTKKLKIGAKLNIIDFIKASITATHEIIENEVKEETKELKNNKKDKAKLAGGDCAKLAGGDSAKLVGGNWATLAGGDFAKLAGGKHSVMIGDSGSIAKGKKGSLIVIVEREWEDSEYVIKDYAAKIVDGETIKEDTFYKLENGEFVEVR
jgi:hypothetical protein